MKNYIIGIALALALVMGVAAFAEAAEPATAPVPALTEEAPAGEAADEAPEAEAEKADDSTALQEALEAYRAAREAERLDDLTEELNGYVEAGKLTQEQADLILNSMKERMAANNGECPNCGHQFRNDGSGMGGRKGRFGGGRMNGGRMNGGMMNGQMNGGCMNGGRMNGGRMNGRQLPDDQTNGSQAQDDLPQAPRM